MHRERFAPSPTGPLHLGHALSAITGYERARAAGGAFVLRIEDIDQSRSRTHWEEKIFDDLAWLGLQWEEPVLRQSNRTEAYADALSHLKNLEVIYPCKCQRRDILAAASAPQEGGKPMTGPDGTIYPGTCKERPPESDDRVAWRLDISKAFASLGKSNISYLETGNGEDECITVSESHMHKTVGDFVVARRDMGTSYHLAVVVDDADQSITHVTRGEDLAEATALHVLLQALLRLPTPIYNHHRLIRDNAGKRLAKRDDARSLETLRQEGLTPEDIRALVLETNPNVA